MAPDAVLLLRNKIRWLPLVNLWKQTLVRLSKQRVVEKTLFPHTCDRLMLQPYWFQRAVKSFSDARTIRRAGNNHTKHQTHPASFLEPTWSNIHGLFFFVRIQLLMMHNCNWIFMNHITHRLPWWTHEELQLYVGGQSRPTGNGHFKPGFTQISDLSLWGGGGTYVMSKLAGSIPAPGLSSCFRELFWCLQTNMAVKSSQWD